MIASPGATMGVDFEQRVDYDRLRAERLQRARAALQASDLGALLLFDMNNIRYVTSTHIGEWARDKMARYAFMPREGDPILWDFGSAAKNHRLYAPWLPESSWRAGVASMRGALPPDTGLTVALARKIAGELRDRGLAGAPLGLDIADVPTVRAFEAEGIDVVDGQQVMLNARTVKTRDEIAELVRVAAPVYLKFGLRNAPNIYPSGSHLEGTAVALTRERLRRARIGLDLLRRLDPSAVMSPLPAPATVGSG